MYFLLREASNMVRDLFGEKCGALAYRATGGAIVWNCLILPTFVQLSDV